ncbi:MAG: hypothetical protein NTX91_04550 [candidate division SR1 bacterium]|nr:hypothetical protein [candidate division SR1 bacterium]
MNIGPFKGQALTCFFPQGKYLIKAPIGSGKSFLFFDGPMFALYKLANRNMLNALSKEGYIKILVEVNNELYFIVRNLKGGKSKDSCSSTLYKMNGTIADCELQITDWKAKHGYGILVKNLDVADMLKDLNFALEEIPFKNETDLQQNLQSVLQPKEVFLNTVFLMQDSENIFQLTPADRLTVLKNVFNLLAIDEGKEVIAEKKREITYKLKATADTSKYDIKLQNLLNRYIDGFTTLKTFSDYADFSSVIEKKLYSDFLADMELIREKITITDFAVDVLPTDIVTDLDARIGSYKAQYTALEQSKQVSEKEYEKNKLNVQTSQQKVGELEKNITDIDKKIAGLDPEKIQVLKNEKITLQKGQDELEAKMPKDQFLKFYESHTAELDFELSGSSINELNFFTHSLVNYGKQVNEKIQTIDLQIKNQELRANQLKTTLEQEVKNIGEKIKDLEIQQKNLDEKIKLFDSETEQQATFDCSKIGTNCPFIKIINKQHFEKLEEQKKRFLEEKKSVETNVLVTKDQLTKKEQELKELTKQSTTSTDIETYKKGQEKLQALLADIKTFLNEVNYASLQKDFASYQEAETKIKSVDKDISSLEDMLRQVETLRLDREKFSAQISSLQETMKQATIDQEAQQKEILAISEKIQTLQPEKLQKIENITVTIKETQRDLQVLINEFKDIQIEVKGLQEEEKLLNELYNIFAKELLLMVLQDSLPVLNDIINNYLTQVVDYQIKFALEKTSSDKLELAATIIDEKGEREIKSLSGGQMIILKLVRMLSISSYIHSPILFLDETINNLDAETVGKVADLLEDFVQSRDMKLYTVTHSQQIQDMDIRDEIVEIVGSR